MGWPVSECGALPFSAVALLGGGGLPPARNERSRQKLDSPEEAMVFAMQFVDDKLQILIATKKARKKPSLLRIVMTL